MLGGAEKAVKRRRRPVRGLTRPIEGAGAQALGYR